jgi:hypothetical protein
VKRTDPNWLTLAFDAWVLGAEASAVMGLRMARICAGGPTAEAEARRMVQEKIDAALDLQRIALTGGLGTTAESAGARTVKHYRARVRANARRLRR